MVGGGVGGGRVTKRKPEHQRFSPALIGYKDLYCQSKSNMGKMYDMATRQKIRRKIQSSLIKEKPNTDLLNKP